MKKYVAATLLLIALVATFAWAAPVSNTLLVTNATDIDVVDEHQAALDKLANLKVAVDRAATRIARAQARLTASQAAHASAGVRIRRGLVRYKPALGGTLPAVLTDAAVDASVGGQRTIHWNAAAATFRNPPPP